MDKEVTFCLESLAMHDGQLWMVKATMAVTSPRLAVGGAESFFYLS